MAAPRKLQPVRTTDAAGSQLRRVSLVEQVAHQLREDILSGRLEPGERVRIQALTERFGVSHIPVREAMRELAAEGLLVSSGTTGMQVSGMALDDLSSLYDLRRLIECWLSREGAPRLTDRQVATIFELLANLTSIDYHHPEYWAIHRDFHRAMLAPLLTHWSQVVLEQLWRASDRYVRLYTYRFGSIHQAMDQHRAMAEACAGREGDTLAELTRIHLEGTQRAIEEGYRRAATQSTRPGDGA